MMRKHVLKRRESESKFQGKGGYPGRATLFFMVHSMFSLAFFEVVGAVLLGVCCDHNKIPTTV